MKSKEWVFPFFLLVYHLAFAFLAWQYNLHNASDAYRYWHLTEDWKQYLEVGTDVIKLINYPFTKFLQLPFWAGFIIHSLIGFYAIVELYKFASQRVGTSNRWSKYGLMLIFLLPNLHFWTSIIGKEPIVFLATTWVVINCSFKQFKNPKLWLGAILLMLIRPHVAMFLLIAIGLVFVLKGKVWTWKKGLLIALLVAVSMGLYLMTMQLLNRNPFNIAYILERNNASLLAFKRAGSYVPMLEYNILERLFALNFRPFFEKPLSLYSLVLSAENLIILVILLYALGWLIRHYRRVKLDDFFQIAVWFGLISSLFFIQRYSCLGIFVRTKIMYLPFLLIAALQIITQIKSPPRDQA